jgi:hypothetical protein
LPEPTERLLIEPADGHLLQAQHAKARPRRRRQAAPRAAAQFSHQHFPNYSRPSDSNYRKGKLPQLLVK